MGNPVDDGGADLVTAFERDEAIIAEYDKAKLRYVRGLTEEAEIKLRYAFAERREAINIEIANLRDQAKAKLHEAASTAAAYALRLPHRVARNGVTAPSLWERIVTMNQIAPFYRNAARSARELDALNAAVRSCRERLDGLEREVRRAIYLREEAARKRLQTPEGLAAFHSDPINRRAYDNMQRVLLERAAYEDRVARGEVPPIEARDREMSQRRQRFARVPMRGTIIARLVRYGPLEYYVLRDLEGYEYLLSCDPALEPLRDLVFDVTESYAGLEVTLRYSTAEVPMRVLDHLRASLSAADAADAFTRHRTALRNDRPHGTTDPTDRVEAAVCASLCLLAEAVSSNGIPQSIAPDAGSSGPEYPPVG